MRILFVCNEYPPTPHGGIGTFVYSLARQLTARGQEAVVVGFDPTVQASGWKMEEGVSIYRIRSPYRDMKGIRVSHYELNPAFLLERMYLSKQVNRIVKEKKIDLVESYDWSGPLWSRPSVPLVVRLHGTNTAHCVYEGLPVSRLLQFVEKRNVNLADELVAVSDHIGQLTLRALDVKDREVTTIYNGVDTNLFKSNGRPQPSGRILFVGTLHRRKGVYELFRAFSMIHAQYPKARLSVVGRTSNQLQLQDELLALLPVQARNNVEFSGRIPFQELPAVYSGATLAVFPSHAEAFGLTCVEAMSCGLPVVMTSRASGPEIVEDGVSGLLADPHSPSGIAGAILALLENQPLREQLGVAARARVMESFNLDSMVQKNIDCYERLIHRRAQ
jgi:glycosyltransferase involved in cell wall biosynthesis